MKKSTLVYLIPAFLFCSQAWADTLFLKTGRELKGLVVEEHEDRVIFSTVTGEIPVLRRGIKKIDYSDPAQNFMQVGREYEKKQRWGEALGYYEKAVELNSNLDEAKQAVVRVRNHFWARAAAGPAAEIERKQSLHDTRTAPTGGPRGEAVLTTDPGELLWESLGIRLMKQGEWVRLSEIAYKKGGSARAGLKAGDGLVGIDGNSLRYLSMEAVRERMIAPRYSTFTLEYERDIQLPKTGFEKSFRDFGFDVRLTSRGIVIAQVTPDGPASRAGLKVEDAIVQVNGESTRYLPLKKLMGVIQQTKNQSDLHAVVTVRRSTLLTRR